MRLLGRDRKETRTTPQRIQKAHEVADEASTAIDEAKVLTETYWAKRNREVTAEYADANHRRERP